MLAAGWALQRGLGFCVGLIMLQAGGSDFNAGAASNAGRSLLLWWDLTQCVLGVGDLGRGWAGRKTKTYEWEIVELPKPSPDLGRSDLYPPQCLRLSSVLQLSQALAGML